MDKLVAALPIFDCFLDYTTSLKNKELNKIITDLQKNINNAILKDITIAQNLYKVYELTQQVSKIISKIRVIINFIELRVDKDHNDKMVVLRENIFKSIDNYNGIKPRIDPDINAEMEKKFKASFSPMKKSEVLNIGLTFKSSSINYSAKQFNDGMYNIKSIFEDKIAEYTGRVPKTINAEYHSITSMIYPDRGSAGKKVLSESKNTILSSYNSCYQAVLFEQIHTSRKVKMDISFSSDKKLVFISAYDITKLKSTKSNEELVDEFHAQTRYNIKTILLKKTSKLNDIENYMMNAEKIVSTFKMMSNSVKPQLSLLVVDADKLKTADQISKYRANIVLIIRKYLNGMDKKHFKAIKSYYIAN
jgi:hypothetical protein